LSVTKENGKWVADFGPGSNATAWGLSVAICAASLKATGIKVEVDSGIA
jgi:hypothetical protein